MPGRARVGIDHVNGGLILGPGATTVLVNGAPQACVGDAIAAHAPFTGLHNSAVISTGSATVKAGSRPVARIGDLCSCGHAIASGSTNVMTNS